MNLLESARDHYLSRHEEFARGLGDEPGWLSELRREALGCFAELGLPSTRLEEWRHTSVRPIATVPFELPPPGPSGVSREALEPLVVPLFEYSRFVFVDGRFDEALSARPALGGGAAIESLGRLSAQELDPLGPYLGGLADHKRHPFVALNTAFRDDGALLRVPRGTRLDSPIQLVFVDSGRTGPSVCHPRLLVIAEEGSFVRIIQDHVSLDDGQGFTNAVVEAFIEPGAVVEYVLLQRQSPAQVHVSNLSVRLERDARFTGHTVTLSGAWVRNDAAVVLAGEGAECILNGLFVGDGTQLIDNHTLVDHAMPHCRSRELYKGILAGRAKGVFGGRIIVRPDAQHTNAEQSNLNLLLSDTAQINTKPQLEIHADDVKCSHGSAIGRLDDDAIFYLQARGIGETEARAILARGFASEVTGTLSNEPLRAELDRLVSEKLDRGTAERETA